MQKKTTDINLREDILICGHRNPDTDSVCSAYALQCYKQSLGEKARHIAVRCGHLNPQTKYIFSRLNLSPPPLLADAHYRARDIMRPICLPQPYAPVAEAVRIMKEQNLRLVPVRDAQGQYQGVYTLEAMTDFLIERTRSTYTNYEIALENLVSILDAEVLIQGQQEQLNAGFLVGSMDSHQIETYFEQLDLRQFFLVIGHRGNIIHSAMQRGVAGVIITGGSLSNQELKELCPQGYRGWVLRTNLHSENVIRASVMASSVHAHLRQDVQTVQPDSLLDETKPMLERQSGVPVVNEQGKLCGLVRRVDIINIQRPRLILTDHNEPAQSIPGSENCEVLEIIDHHRLAPRPTNKPINLLTAPVGSTCTLIAELFSSAALEIPMDAAKVMLSGIISDTIMLRSPTTTQRDQQAVALLSQVTGLDPIELGQDIYTNGSMLQGMPAEQIVTNDFKEFQHNRVQFGIGQVEVVNLCEIEGIEPNLIAELDRLTIAQGGHYDWVVLLITDIHTCNSILLSSHYQHGQQKLSYKEINPQVYDLPGVMSRKKQLLPAIIEALTD